MSTQSDTAGPSLPAPLPEHLTSRGGSADLLVGEITEAVTNHIEAHPRSLQRVVGPSEVGHPCSRYLTYKALDADAVNTIAPPKWKSFIGTCVHEGLASAQDSDNLRHAAELGGSERWLVETPVCVGTVLGTEIWGTADLYDRVTCTVIDHKIQGKDPRTMLGRKGPPAVYRAQLHLYARGFIRAGLQVDTVILLSWPREGEMRETEHWSEPYDEQIAIDALTRLEGIAIAAETMGTDALAVVPTADHYCHNCPFYKHGSTDLSTGCPGDQNASVNSAGKGAFTDIIG
ncbi:MAG: hypothetical protein ACRDQA_05950 [Nocardioidaceae bacterium]